MQLACWNLRLLCRQWACTPRWGETKDVHQLFAQWVSVPLMWYLQPDASEGLFKGSFDLGSTADFRPSPLLDLTISYEVILKALWISPEYWLHGDWLLLHFWESRFLKCFGVCVLIYPTKISWVSTVCQVEWAVMMVQRCALDEISVEWVPNFPLKRL